MKPFRSGTAALLLVLSGCSGERTAEGPAPAPEPIAPAAPAQVVPAPAPPASIPEAELLALLARWTEAQNHGAFAQYEALYATRFTGVRRNAERTNSFDREGWLRDRRRMFARPMVVTTRDVVVRSGASTAELSFVQRWSSGTYSDEGPKRIVVVREGGQLRITVEEMLAAARLGQLDAALSFGTFVALPGDGGPVVVLAPADADRGAGEPTFLGTSDPLVVGRRVGPNAPKSLTSLVGRELTALTRNAACAATVQDVHVAMLVVPHFSTVDAWEGTGLDDRTAPLPVADRAREAWEMGRTAYYVAKLTTDCVDAVAATFTPLAEVHAYVPRVPTPDERRALVGGFARTSRFRDHERAYRDYLEGGLPDEDHPAPPAQRARWFEEASIVVFEREARSVGVVVHNAEGCGGFDDSAWASFELGAARPSEHALERPLGDYISVVAVFDIGGDGVLEAVVRRGVGGFGIARIAPRVAPMVTVDVDFLDCPC